MEDKHMWRVAADLMTAHGNVAQDEALKRADAAIDNGDIDGFTRWKRIARLISELHSKAPSGGDMH